MALSAREQWKPGDNETVHGSIEPCISSHDYNAGFTELEKDELVSCFMNLKNPLNY